MLQVRVPASLWETIENARQHRGVSRTQLILEWLELGRSTSEHNFPDTPKPAVEGCTHPRDRETTDGVMIRCTDCGHRIR